MSERDLLISKIVDREESPADWQRLDTLAERDGVVTQRLVDALRVDSELRCALGDVVGIADSVELADLDAEATRRLGAARRNAWLVNWSGWMAAAVLALIWLSTDPRMRREVDAETTPVAESRLQKREDRDPSQRPDVRLAGDNVMRELPDVLVETRPIPDSDYVEVFYVRRTLQRAVVSDAYRLSRDEIGQPIRTPADLTRWESKKSF